MLTNDEIKDLRNKHQKLEDIATRYLDALVNAPGIDQRCLALAKTNMQQSLMWLRAGTQKESIDE